MQRLRFVLLINLLGLGIMIPGALQAQSSGLPLDSSRNASQVRIGIGYTSDVVYLGRYDSNRVPYLTPSVGYYHKSGLYLNSALSFLLSENAGRVDLVKVKCGYQYLAPRFIAGASLSQYFFNDLSSAVTSELQTLTMLNIGYDFLLFKAYMDAGLGFSDNADFFLGTEINRALYLAHGNLSITPAVYFKAGTQHYYDAYVGERSSHGSGMGQGGNPAMGTTRISEADAFKPLDLETGLQLAYRFDHVRTFLSATWIYPFNPSLVISDQGSYQEDLRTQLIWSIGGQLTLQ